MDPRRKKPVDQSCVTLVSTVAAGPDTMRIYEVTAAPDDDADACGTRKPGRVAVTELGTENGRIQYPGRTGADSQSASSVSRKAFHAAYGRARRTDGR